MAVMLVIKGNTAQHLVAMANMEVTVYTNAVRIVGMARYVTRCMDIVPPVNLGFKGFSVMKNAKTEVLERVVSNIVEDVYMGGLVITLLAVVIWVVTPDGKRLMNATSLVKMVPLAKIVLINVRDIV